MEASAGQGNTIGIRAIGTAVPPTVIRQEALRDLLAAQPQLGRLGKRLVTAAFDASAIETRHTVLEEFGDGSRSEHPTLYGLETGTVANPGTGARNAAYVEHSKPLIVEAARSALASLPRLTPADITHVVTVSCTGFFAPGPDQVLVRELGLDAGVQRYHLGFLGCYAAFPALRAAKQFCEADADAVVLIVSVELCSLHLHVSDDPDTIVASSVFADGAAAAIVTGRDFSARQGTPRDPRAGRMLALDSFRTALLPEAETEMAWTIGDHGFDMVLSTYVPKILEQHAGEAIRPLLDADPELVGVGPRDVDLWAVHPGGRSILDRVQSALDLDDRQLDASREVLRDFGNMSSATVLFVLERLLEAAPEPARELVGAAQGQARGMRAPALADTPARLAPTSAPPTPGAPETAAARRVCSMAFGPGLTVETALLTLRDA